MTRKATLTLVAVLTLVALLATWRIFRKKPAEDRTIPSPAAEVLAATEPRRLPLPRDDREYVGSQACQSCHPQEHSTWQSSFHRTMTQEAKPETVIPDLTKVELQTRGRDFRLWREGDSFWAEMVDPDWDEQQRARGTENESDPPRVRRPVVMLTGSHHFQTLWINGKHGNELWQFPWVYHIAHQRWMPAEDAFVAPPELPRRLTKWNDNCIQCHAVGGQPGADGDGQHFTSRVAQLGIACEACHGPGQRHVEFHRARTTDKTAVSSTAEDPIVNPKKLPHDRASQVCGQCHSYFSFSDENFWKSGFTYRPGDDLHQTRVVHDYHSDYVQSRPDLEVGYWKDGTIRLAGREFSALDDSACFQHGELSCLSCHSLHRFESASDQLGKGMGTDQACLQCHPGFRDRIAEHTHHAAESSGSRCYNCHMPHTSFGLLKAIRSHRIDSPTARMTADFGRPNACNLCHVNESLGWTAKRLTEWYGHEPLPISSDEKPISMALDMLLAGDAAQRAVVAWNLGREEVVGQKPPWPPAYLALSLLDTYAAVRFAAYEALRRYPGFDDFEYDFLASPEKRSLAMREAIERWRRQLPAQPAWSGAPFLLNSDGSMDIRSVQQRMGARDNRPILLPE